MKSHEDVSTERKRVWGLSSGAPPPPTFKARGKMITQQRRMNEQSVRKEEEKQR